MGANGFNGVRDNVAHSNAQPTFSFSRTVTYVAVANIQELDEGGGGATLVLPDLPAEGDRYEFACTDGSCSNLAPIFVTAEGGWTITGLSELTFTNPYAWGVFIFQGGGENAEPSWMAYSDEIAPSKLQSGTVTLVAGVRTVAIPHLSPTSVIFLSRKTEGGTTTTTIQYDAPGATRVPGGIPGTPGAASFVVQAATAADGVNVTDTSTLDYLVVG